MEHETTSPVVSASSVVREAANREHIKALAATSALEMPGDCTQCGGSGCSSVTARRVVHCFASDQDWFGTNWDLSEVLAAIDVAEYVRWEDFGGHDLVVEIDGCPRRFAVRFPALVKDAGSAA